jgi:hypothetical protein
MASKYTRKNSASLYSLWKKKKASFYAMSVACKRISNVQTFSNTKLKHDDACMHKEW